MKETMRISIMLEDENEGYRSAKTYTEEETFEGDFYTDSMFPKSGVTIKLLSGHVITANRYAFNYNDCIDTYTATTELLGRIFEVNIDKEDNVSVNVYASHEDYDDDVVYDIFTEDNRRIVSVEWQ